MSVTLRCQLGIECRLCVECRILDGKQPIERLLCVVGHAIPFSRCGVVALTGIVSEVRAADSRCRATEECPVRAVVFGVVVSAPVLFRHVHDRTELEVRAVNRSLVSRNVHLRHLMIARQRLFADTDTADRAVRFKLAVVQGDFDHNLPT